MNAFLPLVLCLLFVSYLVDGKSNDIEQARIPLWQWKKTKTDSGKRFLMASAPTRDTLPTDPGDISDRGSRLEEQSEVPIDRLRKKKDPFLKYVKKRGRLIVDLSHHDTHSKIRQTKPILSLSALERKLQSPKHDNTHLLEPTGATTAGVPNKTKDIMEISLDPFAAIRLVHVLYLATNSFLMAFVGTLKLLGPLIFSRRVLAQVGELGMDYMTGRYLRTTYDHIERKYWKYYQGPAACRSVGRCLANLLLLFQFGRFMEWMIELESFPCLIPRTGTCHWWCGLLWIMSVVGAGNFGSMFLRSRWPFQIKVTKSATLALKRKRRRVFMNPFTYLQWMRDPDRWLTSIATARRDNTKYWKPFSPDPLLFPSTWPPFSMLRNMAVAKAMATSSNLVHNSMHLIMQQFLVQQACMDEWYRVLMEERRVGLGIFAIAVGFIATSSLFVTVALADRVSAVLMLPWIVATFSSGWMNLFVFWDRRRDMEKRQRVVMPIMANHGRQQHRQSGSPLYTIKW